MTSKRTTHELASLLQQMAEALRQMPNIPLSDIRPSRSRKKEPTVDVIELATILPQLRRDEVASRLNGLGQRQLVQLCKQMKVNVGSKRTKSSLIHQILWQLFEAKDELERIRTYEEKPGRGEMT